MAFWHKQLDSLFSGMGRSVGQPAPARPDGPDGLFGRMLDRFHDDRVPPADDERPDEPDGQNPLADPSRDQSERPGLADFDRPRNYGSVVIEDGEDPYAEMSAADHEIEYQE